MKLVARIFLYSISIFFAGINALHEAWAQTPSKERIAIVVDSSNNSFEVQNLSYKTKYNYVYSHAFGEDLNKIIIKMRTSGGSDYYIGLPLSDLISLQISSRSDDVYGRGCIAVYQWQGKQRNIRGYIRYAYGDFSGKTDSGSFELPLKELRKITFNKDLDSLEDIPIIYDSVFILADGTNLPVSNLKRFSSYSSSAGYIVGSQTYYRRSSYLVLKGKARVHDFVDIKRIDFDLLHRSGSFTGNVNITLKNGEKVTGELDRFMGFSGFSEEGEIFIDASSRLESILFNVDKD